ncbi:MAG: hypothetical protein DMG14_32190 [Acidobacteria bacterium]|nr:MAG: hypothetical protein DMG14_32190 [Acidobacteriota bacterium]
MVQFYETESSLAEAVTRFLMPGLELGHPIVIIATPEHVEAFLSRFAIEGIDIGKARDSHQLILLDASDTLSRFMIGDLPDANRFKEAIGRVLEESRDRHGDLAVLAFGEMVDILWREGKTEAAVRLEQLWNELATLHSFRLYCAYAMNGFYKQTPAEFQAICAQHSRVIATEHSVQTGRSDAALLQQRSLALEAELKHHQQIQQALLQALDERRQAEEKLRITEQELREFFENAVVGLHWVGEDGKILWANQAELDLLGYSRDEYIGHHIGEFHVDAEVVEDILARLGRNETLLGYETRLRCKDGSIRHVLIDSNAYRQNGKFVHTRCFTRDITDRKQAEVAQLWLRAIVESADDAIISKTLEGIITSWNSGAERIFGYSAQEAIGKPVAILIPADHPNEEPEILKKLRAGERIDHYETQRVRKDGRIIDVSLSVSPIKDHRGRIVGASKIARDITERKRIEQERDQLLRSEMAARAEAEQARAEAENANRLKDEFLAVLSHELRTPLSPILGWANILGSRNDEESVRRGSEVIYRNAVLQKRLIDDLLDMSRILSGKMVIKNEAVDLTAVLHAAVDTVRAAAAAKAIILETDMDESARFITGDADRLQQVVWNLLSNSLKFTPVNGRVRLRLRKNQSNAEIIVEDTGEGISQEFLPRVFDRFCQADGGTARQHGGLD